MMATRFFALLLVLFGAVFSSRANLSRPSPSVPISNITLKRFDVTFLATNVSGATGYEYQYDTSSAFNSPMVTSVFSSGNSSSRSATSGTLRKGQTYFWRTRCFNSTDTSGWSSAFNFTVLESCELNFPQNNVEGPLTSLRVISLTSDEPVTYIFEMDTVNTMNSSSFVRRTSNDRALIDSNYFTYGKTIYWRATAVNKFGDTLDWSPIWKYTIKTVPEIFKVGKSSDPQTVVQWPDMGLAEVELQLDTQRNFSSTESKSKILDRYSRRDTLRNLYFGEWYYWRIRGVFGNQKSDWSVVDSFFVSEDFTFVFPQNNGSLQSLVVQFRWDNRSGMRYQFQLSENTDFAVILKDSTLAEDRMTLPDTLYLNRPYFWRVRGMHDTDTSKWSEFQFRTFTGQLRIDPPSPRNNTTDHNIHVNIRFIQASWATAYLLQIDTGKQFNIALSDEAIVVDTFENVSGIWNSTFVDLKYDQDYVYRVFAIRYSDTSESTIPVTFRTKSGPLPHFPPDNFIGIGTQTNALIVGVDGSDSVHWELDTSMAFNSPLKQFGSALHEPDDFQPQYIQVELPGELNFETRYYWRTRCVTDRDSSQWSISRSFTTTQRPWLSSPANDAQNVVINPKLDWGIQGSDDDYTYEYQIAKDSNLSTAGIQTLSKGDPSEKVVNLDYGSTYYWRARAFHTRDTSSWSLIHRFSTVAAPQLSKPQLSRPFNGASNIPLAGVNLVWFGVNTAQSYDIQVSTNSNFTNLVATGNPTSTAVAFTNLNQGTRYYWRVRARRPDLVGPWSDSWFFESVRTNSLETRQQEPINVYPNPASSVIQIVGLSGEAEIQIYDLLARRVLTLQKILPGNLDISQLNTGTYIIHIHHQHQLYTQRLNIAH